jgi:hypothetical protein
MAVQSHVILGPSVIIYTEVRWAGFWETPRLEKVIICIFWLVRAIGSTVVRQSTHNQKIKGSSPAVVNGRGKMAKYILVVSCKWWTQLQINRQTYRFTDGVDRQTEECLEYQLDK